eukprot:4869877-Alexandrium_andersonii.AAC.1
MAVVEGASQLKLIGPSPQPVEELPGVRDPLLFPELGQGHPSGPRDAYGPQDLAEVRLAVGGQGQPEERNENMGPG